MTSISSTSSLDPATTAQQLATAYTQDAQTQLTTEAQNAQSTSTGLATLNTALTVFESAMDGLSNKQTMSAMTAAFSNTAIGTATVGATATSGSYPMFVQQLATQNQLAYANVPSTPAAAAGTLALSLGNGTTFNVDLSKADSNGDGTVSQTELARAINAASGNNGAVTAMVMTTGSQTQLMLTSGVSGQAGALTVDASGLASGALQTALSATPNILVAAQDAIVWMGAQGTGVKVQQSSNTFTGIQGVSINLTQAQAAGDPPVTFNVNKDDSGTAANVQTFVSAYNALNSSLNSLTSMGDSTNGTAAAAFADDSGVTSLQDKLATMVRQSYGGVSLYSLGISIDQSGTMSVDTTKLSTALASNPTALDTVFGSSTPGLQTGMLGDLSKVDNSWTNPTTGQIQQRQASVTELQKSLTDRQTELTNQYNDAYNRYLAQFSALQTLQAQMDQTTSMLANI